MQTTMCETTTVAMEDSRVLGSLTESTESCSATTKTSKGKFGSKKIRRTLRIKVRQCLICGAVKHKKRKMANEDDFDNETYEWDWNSNDPKCKEMSKQDSTTTHSPQSSTSGTVRTSFESSSDEGISSGYCETSDDDEYIKDTTPLALNENNDGEEERGGIVGAVQQVISVGFSSFFYVCI